ncbi:MAG: leucine-rich repeat protein, partial [Clostridia bacterium]|nr:leucine-rich repeat protein [Clostridia bacterium]
LSTITIPESVTMVEDYAFNYCSNLIGAVIKGGAKTIGSNVFESCSLLEEIEIGVGITKIGANLINDCDNIERITYKGTTAQWSNISRVKTFNTEHVYQTVTCSDGSAYLYA